MWRKMLKDDLFLVNKLSDEIHINYPEGSEIFEERFNLYPDGCFVLQNQNCLVGYAISHPWIEFSIPPLNSFLNEIPDSCNTYYIHDIAIAPSERGQGFSKEIMAILKDYAQKLNFSSLSAVAVNKSTPIWIKEGFRIVDVSFLQEKLKSYDNEAVYIQYHYSI